MMQAFDALFGGQRAASSRGTTSGSPRASNAQDDANASGGFDRMLRAQGSRGAASNTTRMAETTGAAAKANDAPRASEPSRASDETKSSDTKTKDPARETSRADAKDDAPREADACGDDADTATASTADETGATSGETSTTASTTTTNDAATPALPEQMLALLNGLAGANAAPAAATAAPTTEALPPGLVRGDAVATATDPRAGNATAPVLPTLPGAPPAAVAPTDGDATAAFAMAMGAAASSDTKADAGDAALDTTAIGDTTPATLPTASTTPVHTVMRTAAAAATMNAPLALDDGFDDGFSSRIAWMADQKVGHAEIRVTPDHLGAIDVRLQVDGNRVNAEFHSAQADVRHALESSLPRLRDMLGQQGLQLGQADVGQRQAQQQPGSNGTASMSGGGNERGDAANDAGWTRGPAARVSRGLLDEYA